MGLISGLLTLPLAPVRGTVWLAEKLQEQGEAELNDEDAIRASLFALAAARERGEHTPEEIDAAEDALLEQLMFMRGIDTEGTHGDLE